MILWETTSRFCAAYGSILGYNHGVKEIDVSHLKEIVYELIKKFLLDSINWVYIDSENVQLCTN
jgi:hypothetical protein